MPFRFRAFDSALFPNTLKNCNTLSFFEDDSTCSGERVTGIIEDRIVSWLFSQYLLRNLLFEEMNLNMNSLYGLRVTEPFISDKNKKPGDIDVFVCDKQLPCEAVVIECKRVKVETSKEGIEKVNKIHCIGEGVKQANALRELGFHKSYLALLAEVDGMYRDEYNVLGRGMSTEVFHQLYDFPKRDNLHEDVGLIFIEIVQPTGKIFKDHAMVAVCVEKKAKPLEQSIKLSNMVKDYLKRRL